MEQVLDVYKRPYDPKRPVICLDESPKQLVSEIRAPIITSTGQQLYDYEYRREGVCDIYMVSEPLAGKRFVSVQDAHNRLVWAKVVAELVENQYASADKITLVQDNLSAHQPYAMYELFEPARARAILDQLEFVFTPKHGSWLNMAEIELSVLARQCTKGRFSSKQALEQKIQAWQQHRNQSNATIDWQFTTHDARIKLKKLYPSFCA